MLDEILKSHRAGSTPAHTTHLNKDNMNKETIIQAVKDSIKHWETNERVLNEREYDDKKDLKGTLFSIEGYDCDLCRITEGNCLICPLREYFGLCNSIDDRNVFQTIAHYLYHSFSQKELKIYTYQMILDLNEVLDNLAL